MRTREDMAQDWKGKRDYWLNHYGQLNPGLKRGASTQTFTPSDYIAIPIPFNTPTPLAFPCLIWRWGLGARGTRLWGAWKPVCPHGRLRTVTEL